LLWKKNATTALTVVFPSSEELNDAATAKIQWTLIKFSDYHLAYLEI
jgi:hypothetical protein